MNGVQADLSIGEQLQGQDRPLYVRGYLLFKEWDPEDEVFYYWEEWQLGGMSEADVWIELDHDEGRVFLYEPLRFVERLDPTAMTVGQSLTLSSGVDTYSATVTHVASGTLEQALGDVTAPITVGETMGYAEIELVSAGGERVAVTVDSHGWRDMVTYRKIPLSRAEQRRLLGKVVHRGRVKGSDGATSGRLSRAGAVRLAAGLVLFAGAFSGLRSCRRFPSTIGPSGDGTPTDGSGHGRPVHGGGGGGVGK